MGKVVYGDCLNIWTTDCCLNFQFTSQMHHNHHAGESLTIFSTPSSIHDAWLIYVYLSHPLDTGWFASMTLGSQRMIQSMSTCLRSWTGSTGRHDHKPTNPRDEEWQRNTLAWELHLEEAGVSTDRSWCCVAPVYHSPQPLFYCRVQHANRCIRSTMVFPERVQSLRLSKWACQGGEYHLMFTHDQHRVLQWVLTRLPL